MANNMSYQRAKTVRSTSLTDLILDRMASGQGTFGSIRSSLSEKSKAKATGFKEKFDPLNIVKFMTGGSNLATGIVGKMMGRSQGDIDYFTGRKRTSTRLQTSMPSPQENISGSTEAASNIYNFLKNTRNEKKRELEIMKNFEEEKMLEEERQHTEIINIFNKALGKKKTKQKDLSSMKMDFNKVFKKKAAPKAKEEVEADDEKGFLDGLSKKLALVALGGVAVAGGAAVYGATRKEEAPEGGTTATKIPSERVSTIESEPVKKAIRAREGGGETPYSVINRVAGETTSYIVKKGNIDVTTKQPYTKNLEEMTISEVLDLQARRSKYFNKKGMGSAVGAYGFMPTTLAFLAKAKYGTDKWANVPFTKDVQDSLADDLISIIKNNIKKAGLPVSEAMIYSMWFFGHNDPKTAYQLVYGATGNTKIDQLVSESVLTANPHLKGQTVDWYRENVLNKKKAGSLSTIPLEGTVPGDTLMDKQKENTNMKDGLSDQKHSSLMINRIINPSIQNNYNTNILSGSEPHPVLG